MKLSIAILWIYFCELVVSSSRLGDKFLLKDPATCCSTNPLNPASNCAQTTLTATYKFQYAPSPGFPNRFPVDRQCTWTLQSRPEVRIRLEFRDFYLIGPNNQGECVEQYVLIKSPITGYEMGPFCGNTGIQVIVSAGNLLIVQLFSGIPTSSENFRGFTMAFKETAETPSQQLRPQNWVPNSAIALDSNGIQKVINQLQPKPETPKVLTTAKTIKQKPVRPRRPSTNTPPVKKQQAPKRKAPQSPVNKERPYFAVPPSGGSNHYGPYNNRPVKTIDKSKSSKSKSKLPLSIEVICAIAVGGVVALALIILISCKINQTCKAKKKDKRAVSSDGSGSGVDNSIHMNNIGPQQHKDLNTPVALPEPNINYTYAPENQQSPTNQRSTLQYPPSYQHPPTYNTLPANALPNRAPTGYVDSLGSNNQYSSEVDPVPSAPVFLYDPHTGAMFNSSQLQVVQPVYASNNNQARPATLPYGFPTNSYKNRKSNTTRSNKKTSRKKRSGKHGK